MRKTNLLKTIVCTVVCTLMLATTAFAATKTQDFKVRGQKNYTKTLEGTYGNFTASSNGLYARTSVTNISGAVRYFDCSVSAYNYNKCNYDFQKDVSGKMSNGSTKEAKIIRNMNSWVHDYQHFAASYSTDTSASYSRVDYFDIKACQYYE